MKKLLSALLTVSLLFSLTACLVNDEGTEDNTTEASTVGEVTTSAEEVTTAAGIEGRALMLDNAGLYTVIRSDSATQAQIDAAVALNDAVFRLTGKRLKIDTDYAKSTEDIDPDALEILVGSTNRTESTELFNSLPDGCFAIKVTETKIVIVGRSDKLLASAVEYFIANCLTENNVEYREGMLILKEENIDYVSESRVVLLEKLLKSSDKLDSDCEMLFEIPITLGTGAAQGGYTDGKYYYQGFIKYTIRDADNTPLQQYNECVIVKYDIENSVVVKTSEILSLNHCNDITYNPTLDRLVVCHNAPNYSTASLIDPETLELDKTITLPCNFYSIDYNAKHDMYVVGLSGGQNFRLLNSKFEFVSNIYLSTPTTKGYTTQGATCDDNFIYFVLHNKPVITVYNWDGDYVTTITLDVGGIEPENISVVDGVIYVGCAVSKRARVFKVTPKVMA